METIPEEFVEKTWQEAALLAPDRARKEMTRMSKDQPHLLAFLLESTDDLSPDAHELAVYLSFVVYQMFQGFNKKIRKISPDELMAAYKDTIDFFENLEGVHEKFIDRIVSIQVSTQPRVMKYVVEALMEEPEEGDSAVLTEEDKGSLFLILKTVVEVLDQNAYE